MNPGLTTAPVYIIRSDGGVLRCGGVNRRVGISETGLTAERTFTFPDAQCKINGRRSCSHRRYKYSCRKATTGTKIGTSATQKIGFYNATPVVQPSANPDTTDGLVATLETEVNEIKGLLRAVGLMAP